MRLLFLLCIAPFLPLSLCAQDSSSISLRSTMFTMNEEVSAYESGTTDQNDLTTLFQGSFEFYQLLRNNKGIYRDKARFDGNDEAIPSSVASIGIGLVSLAIGDAMGWTATGKDDAILTLQSLLGRTPGFSPDRNATGFFRHFIDMDTGAQAWDSEYSTIDTAILISGTLFVENYFDDPILTVLVYELWHSIDWESAIQNPDTGGIFRELNPDGTGVLSAVTLPFNEYMIVSWLAYQHALNQDIVIETPAVQLWNNHYADPAQLPTSTYEGTDLLTDAPGLYLSNFIVQFTHYLCNYFNTQTDYQVFFENSRVADKEWWAFLGIAEDYEWGLGAGTTVAPIFYHADRINNNPGNVISPHVMAGFIGSASTEEELVSITDDLSAVLTSGKGVLTLQNGKQSFDVLWRYSLDDPSWSPDDIQGIDYASMLLGLAALPEHLGTLFFTTYNNFDFPSEFELPVELTYFEGLTEEKAIILKWGTTSEKNNAGFAIERLDNDVFEEIAFVAGAGTTDRAQTYQFRLDNQSAGIYTFRLRQIDFDGTFSLSAEVTLSISPTNTALQAAYPNPFNPTTTIPFTLSNKDHVRIDIYNIQGQWIESLLNEEVEPGEYKVVWKATDLANGTYIYKITTSTKALTRTVTLLK